MADLTKEQLAAMLQKLDDVCEQARLLSKQIQKQMADARRREQPSSDAMRTERRRVSRPKRKG